MRENNNSCGKRPFPPRNINFVGVIGPTGPTLFRSAYLVTFNADKSDAGVPVEPEARLPISRLELDVSNLLELDEKEGLIKFNVAGYYKIFFT